MNNALVYYGLVLCLSWLVKGEIFIELLPMKVSRLKVLLRLLGLALIESFLPHWVLSVEPLFLLGILLYLRPAWKLSQYFFYALLPFVLVDMAERLIKSSPLKNVTLLADIDQPITSSLELILFFVVAFMAPLIVFLLFTKIFRLDFSKMSRIFTYPSFDKSIWFFNATLMIYAFIISPAFILLGQEGHTVIELNFGNSTLKLPVLDLQLLLIFVFILYFNFKMKEILDKENAELKEQQLASLSSYSQHVETLYKELRAFRHDYTNVLVSLNESIKNKDINQVEQIYQSVLATSDKRFYDSKYEIPNLSNLTDTAMKSLLSAKLSQAVEWGIEVSVEVPDPIGVPDIELLDMIKVLSILLDNAIEACQESPKAQLTFAYFKFNQESIMVIENTTKEAKIKTQPLFKEGYSSKGEGRGIGLATVKKTSQKYPNLSLKTTSQNHRFQQELIFH